MKILEQGNWNRKWERQVVCKHQDCTAKLLVEESDLRHSPSSQNSFYVICPVCGSKIGIGFDKIPERVCNETKDGKNTSNKPDCPHF
jgi:hypothetical protein